jgi:hypothetical protein
MFYRFLCADGVSISGPTRGPDSRAVQVPVRVAEALDRRAQYLTKDCLLREPALPDLRRGVVDE